MADSLEPALALRFSVEIDGQKFDRFTAVDGLIAEWEVEEYREGGNRDFVHRLAGTDAVQERPAHSSGRQPVWQVGRLVLQGQARVQALRRDGSSHTTATASRSQPGS